MGTLKDPQATKAYAWEDSFAGIHLAKLDEPALRAWVKKAARVYNVPAPTVALRSSNRGARGSKLPSTYSPASHHIVIRPRHANVMVALHETAHAITDWLFGYGLQHHGPTWMGIYMTLLDKFKVAPREALEAYAKAKGLDWWPQDLAAPQGIRTRHAALYKKGRAVREPLKLLGLVKGTAAGRAKALKYVASRALAQ